MSVSMLADKLIDELIEFYEELISSPRDKNIWKFDLRLKINHLINEHLNNDKKPFFVIGESNNDLILTNDVGVQVNISSSTLNNNFVDKTEKINDELILKDLHSGTIKHRELESKYKPTKSVELRRRYIEEKINQSLSQLPFENYDFSRVNGACCENIIGYVPIPTGVAGPLTINNETLYIPMSTCEGALIASTNRGCKAINDSGGVYSVVFKDGMTRAPALRFPSVKEAIICLNFLHKEECFQLLKDAFEATSSYARLTKIEPCLYGQIMFIRFAAVTGDAMGMNMVTKGVSESMNVLLKQFPNAILETISGNMCADKKASAINWILGRGKSVCAEATISSFVVNHILKTDVDKMIRLGTSKLQCGALNSVSIGGGNAHSANIVAAIFLATGQDAAQVVSSSMCSTVLTKTDSGDLNITCTMNCLEVGTVGGGTILLPQQACLKMLKCCGPNKIKAGDNASRLASIICATVLAGELSLIASQCTGDLVRSHLRLNRSNKDLTVNINSSKSLISIPEEAINSTKTFEHNSSVNNLNVRKFSGNLSSKFSLSVSSSLAPKQTETSSIKLIKKVLAKCDQSFT